MIIFASDHEAPLFNKYGEQLSAGLKFSDFKKDNVKIPSQWTAQVSGRPTTQKALFTQRKKEFIPDQSYDLDGDCQVS